MIKDDDLIVTIMQSNKKEIVNLLTIGGKPLQTYVDQFNKLLTNYSSQPELISSLVQSFEYNLVSDKKFQELRHFLRNLKYKENNQEELQMLEIIYRTFCYNQVSAITLSLLVEEYELSYHLILCLSEIEQDAETLAQIARLICLIEQPNFVYLRLQLLEFHKYPYLLKTLIGLMSMLPQTIYYKKIKNRIQNIHNLNQNEQSNTYRKQQTEIDTKKYLQIYQETQQKIQKLQEQIQQDQSL